MLNINFQLLQRFKLKADEYLGFIKFENSFWHYKFAYFYVTLLGCALFFSPVLDFAYGIKPIENLETFKKIAGTCCLLLLFFLSIKARIRRIEKSTLDNILICLWYLCLILIFPCYSILFVYFSDFHQSSITQMIVSLIIFACFLQSTLYVMTILLSYLLAYFYIYFVTNSFVLVGVKDHFSSLLNIHIVFMMCGSSLAYLREIIVKNLMFQTTEMLAINNNLEDLINQRTLEIEENLKLKTDFINNASHEIRIPLQGILSITGILADDWKILDEKKRYEYINLINHSCNRLMIFASNLLDFAKFHSGNTLLQLQIHDFYLILDEIIADFTSFIISKGIKVRFIKSTEELIFFFDKVKVQQILRNLLSNALKYSDTGANIEIYADIILNPNNSLDKLVEIKFIDDGVGVPEAEREKIFEIFTQSSNNFSQLNSSGLGLALVSEYVKMHKGKIWVEENKPKGSIFTVILPYIDEIKRFHKIKEDTRQNFITKEETASSLIYVNEEKILELKTKKVKNFSELKGLIIDDEIICLTSISLMLRSLDIFMETQSDGHEAINTIISTNPDFILLDIMLNGITAIDILKEISRLGLCNNIPIILQSGVVDVTIIEQAKTLGACASVIKPYNKDQIIYLLKKIFF